jgi:hypothetical protein
MKKLSILILACLLAVALAIPVATPVMAATPVTLTLVSGTATQTAGYTTANPSPTPLTDTLYSTPAWPNAAPVASPVIPPWVNPATDPAFSGSGAVWVSTIAGDYGNDGNILTDSWRLFKAEFTIPTGATAISGQVTAVTGDNTFEIYFNNVLLFTTEPNDTVYGVAPPQPGSRDPPYPFQQVYGPFGISPVVGLNTLYFVVRNWDNLGSSNSNPTGLLYKAIITYTLGTDTTTTTKLCIDKKSCFEKLPNCGKTPAITLGQSVTDTATVTGADATPPTGSVEFQWSNDNGDNWNTFSTNGLTPSGPDKAKATSTPFTPAVGNYLFRAIYAGDNIYNISQSADTAEPLKVCKVPTDTRTQLSARTICLNGSVTDKITIYTMAKGTLPAASGTWTLQASKYCRFNKDVVEVGSGPVSGNLPFKVTTQPFTPTSTGTWYFRVIYSGDDNYNKSQNCGLEVLCVVNKVVKPPQPPHCR